MVPKRSRRPANTTDQNSQTANVAIPSATSRLHISFSGRFSCDSIPDFVGALVENTVVELAGSSCFCLQM